MVILILDTKILFFTANISVQDIGYLSPWLVIITIGIDPEKTTSADPYASVYLDR